MFGERWHAFVKHACGFFRAAIKAKTLTYFIFSINLKKLKEGAGAVLL